MSGENLERTFSTLLHIKTYPRSTMTERRLLLTTTHRRVKRTPTNYTTGTRTAHKPHVVFSGRTQLCVTGVSMDLQALKVGKNSPSSVLHANDADLRTH
ncbi:hypothetical protein J6590_040606 [Homalodisca vitripennis]|nr:hypothetical protein J6590_040606 [Homalodisca vitripennis]